MTECETALTPLVINTPVESVTASFKRASDLLDSRNRGNIY